MATIQTDFTRTKIARGGFSAQPIGSDTIDVHWGTPSNPEQARDATERAPLGGRYIPTRGDYSGLSDLKAIACAKASKDGEALPAAWRGWTTSGQTVPGETSGRRSRRNPNERLDSLS